MITAMEEGGKKTDFFNYAEDRNKSWRFRQDIPSERDSSYGTISEAAEHRKRELDVLFKKAMKNLWRSAMHENWSVTPILG